MCLRPGGDSSGMPINLSRVARPLSRKIAQASITMSTFLLPYWPKATV